MLNLEQVIDKIGASGRSSVHAMETSNRIFGVLPPGRMRGKRYPHWQFIRGIAGDPLRQILSALTTVDPWAKYQFFVSSNPELGNLTPINLLSADSVRTGVMNDETRSLAAAPHEERVKLVVELAKEFANPS
jgi:hypothetical protein